MAKVQITITDAPDGRVDLKVVFAPNVRKGETLTSAQQAALTMVDAISNGFGDDIEDEE